MPWAIIAPAGSPREVSHSPKGATPPDRRRAHPWAASSAATATRSTMRLRGRDVGDMREGCEIAPAQGIVAPWRPDLPHPWDEGSVALVRSFVAGVGVRLPGYAQAPPRQHNGGDAEGHHQPAGAPRGQGGNGPEEQPRREDHVSARAKTRRTEHAARIRDGVNEQCAEEHDEAPLETAVDSTQSCGATVHGSAFEYRLKRCRTNPA
jgi:hypothetical protein